MFKIWLINERVYTQHTPYETELSAIMDGYEKNVDFAIHQGDEREVVGAAVMAKGSRTYRSMGMQK